MAFDNSKEPSACLQRYHAEALTNTVVQLGVDGRLNVYGMLIQNNAAAATYLQVFDKAAADTVTPGTTAPLFSIVVPANSTLYLPPERAKYFFSLGCRFFVGTSRTNGAAPATATTIDIWFSQS